MTSVALARDLDKVRNAFDEGELDPEATTERLSAVRRDGSGNVTRSILHYDLDRSSDGALADASTSASGAGWIAAHEKSTVYRT
jgi:hypothetical protein